MKKVMDFIVLSCKKATFLVEKAHSHPLSFIEKVQLHMHLKICSRCANYQKQSLLIENLLKNEGKRLSNPTEIRLSDKSKFRIQKSVEENLK